MSESQQQPTELGSKEFIADCFAKQYLDKLLAFSHRGFKGGDPFLTAGKILRAYLSTKVDSQFAFSFHGFDGTKTAILVEYVAYLGENDAHNQEALKKYEPYPEFAYMGMPVCYRVGTLAEPITGRSG